MKYPLKKITYFLLIIFVLFPVYSFGQESIAELTDSISINNIVIDESSGIHQAIKIKFIEGSAIFMSIIAFTLIAGLAFCLERIIYLNFAQINAKKFLSQIDDLLNKGCPKEAKETARNTRGPVASICYQALNKIEEPIDTIDKSITTSGNVQIGLLEKNLSWISLFISIAPALGFLGTVLGMIQTFDDIYRMGDINSAVVSSGLKFALITTVGGLVVALVLQVFYNYILAKVEEVIHEMDSHSIGILDMITQYKRNL